MKKLICLLCLALCVSLGACSKEDENTPKEETSEIVVNDVYTQPNNPTDYQIEIYNALTEALDENEGVAELVAKNFVTDFYTLKNKESAEDVGGLTYLPTDMRDSFATYASIYAYANYEKISQNYGAKNLPQVKSVEVSESVEGVYSYTTTIPADATTGQAEYQVTDDYDGFEVTVDITFEKTKVSSDELPSSLTLTVIDMDGVYYVIALA